MKRYSLLLFALFAFVVQHADAQGCGAEITDENLEEIIQQAPLMRSFNNGSTRGVLDYPIKAHIVTRSSGTGGITKKDVQDAVDDLNYYYINANIRFILLDDVETIKSDRYYNFNSKDEKEIAKNHDLKHVINLYFFNAVYKFGANVCGYAQYPTEHSYSYNNDRLMLRNDCVLNGATLVHEMGHYFSLLHTHGSNNSKPDEYVTRASDRRNCDSAGDGLCDTAADPMLFGKVDADCRYTRNERDAYGDPYQPEPRNIMAYSVIGCRDQFTRGQYARINYAAIKYRHYIKFPEHMRPVATTTTTSPSVASTTSSTSSNSESTKPPKSTNTYSLGSMFEGPASGSTKPATPSKTRPAEEYAHATAKLSGQLLLEVSGKSVKTKLDGNLYQTQEPFYSGTNYELFLDNDQPAYVYVISSDLTQQCNLLFPLEAQTPMVGGVFDRYALPGGNRMYTLDHNTGKDYLCVLYSRKPLAINSVMQKMASTYGNFMQRLYRVLGDEIVPSSHIQYKNDGRLSFSAAATSGTIVPIVLEIEHI